MIFAGLLALETWASAAWLPIYYRFGIPISVNSARISVPASNPDELARALETRLPVEPGGTQPNRLLHPSLQFRALAGPSGTLSGLLAFRERLFEDRPGGRYLPVMHSVACLTSPGSTGGAHLTVTGYLNWTILYAIGYLIYRAANDPRFVPVALLILVVLLLSYASQNSVNGKVTQQIAAVARSAHLERGKGRD